MKWKRIAFGFGLLLLVIVSLIGYSLYRGFYGGRRIDVSRLERADHPLFQGPRRPDGSVNYLDAIERVMSEDVVLEENFCVTILELSSDDGELSPAMKARYIDQLPFDMSVPDRFRTFQQMSESLDVSASELEQLVYQSTSTVFTDNDAQARIARQILEMQKPSIDRMLRELDQRPRYWMPLVTGEESPESLISVLLPHAQNVRQLARWLKLRSNQNLVDGNLEDVWQDIRGTYQLGNRVAQGFTLVESLVGMAVCGMASEQLQQLLNHPELELTLAEQIAIQLPQVDTIEHWTRSMDLGERAMMLNIVDQLVSGNGTREALGADLDSLERFPWGWVQSERVANDWNRVVDQIIEAGRMQNPGATREVLARLEQQYAGVQEIPWVFVLKAVAGVSPQAEATDLAEQQLFSQLLPGFSMVDQAQFRKIAQQRMLRLAVRLRVDRFRNGVWPANLESMANADDPLATTNPFRGALIEMTVDSDDVLTLRSPGGMAGTVEVSLQPLSSE